MNAALAAVILTFHLVVIAFNVLGLLAILVGERLGWAWVRVRWWRALHVASWGVVAVQAVLGRACFLTVWQDDLSGADPRDPLVMRWVNGLIYWDLPMWVFAALYVGLFGLVLLLWKTAPPRR